jgi:hypothetical protein
VSLDLSRGSLDGGPDCLYALTDGQGNVSAIADAAGVAVERYFHTPDGGVAIKDGVWGADRNISAYGWRVMWHGGRWDSGGVAESGWPYGYGDHYLNGAEWDQIMGGNLAHDPNVYWGRQMAIVVPSVSPIGEAIASVVMTRYVSGAVQMIQGGVEIVLGGAASKTGIGMILGIPLIAHGLDTFQAGLRTFAGEDNVNTLTSQKISEFAQGLGASKSTADTIGAWGDVGIGLVGSVGAMWRIGAVGRAAEQAALRARVMANIAESQAARQASRFGVYAAREAAVMRYASGEAQVGRTVANSTRGWRVGDPINSLTAKGGRAIVGRGSPADMEERGIL